MQAPLALMPGWVALHGDLGAVAGLAGEAGDLDQAAGDLGHLEREELAHESGMRAADRDGRPLEPLAHARDVDADAAAVRVLLAGHLLLGRQDRLDAAEVDVHHPRVRALLHDARDDVALAPAELPQHLVVADVAQALVDDLLGGERRDAAEVVGAVDGLADDLAVVVQLGDVDRHVPGLAVQLDAGADIRGLIGVLQVRRQDRLLDDADEFLERDLALALHQPQHGEVDVHRGLPVLRYRWPSLRQRCGAEFGRQFCDRDARVRSPDAAVPELDDAVGGAAADDHDRRHAESSASPNLTPGDTFGRSS